MIITPVNNAFRNNKLAFRERTDIGGDRPDPWVVERQELSNKYLVKKEDLYKKFENNEISWRKFCYEANQLKNWLVSQETAISEKWQKLCINYKPAKKTFFQKLFRF